jgi:hypothetical protein
MVENIEKIAAGLGAKVVGKVPNTGGGAFGAARLAKIVKDMQTRLVPGQGRRPGRPTDASWVRHPKVPMSDATRHGLPDWPSRAVPAAARSAPCRSPPKSLRTLWPVCRSDNSHRGVGTAHRPKAFGPREFRGGRCPPCEARWVALRSTPYAPS